MWFWWPWYELYCQNLWRAEKWQTLGEVWVVLLQRQRAPTIESYACVDSCKYGCHNRFSFWSSVCIISSSNGNQLVCFEAAVKEVSTFFTETMCGDGYRRFRALQKTVWYPFSIYATFDPYKNSLINLNGDVFVKKLKKQWITILDCRKNFPKTPPLLWSKTVFEFHCD